MLDQRYYDIVMANAQQLDAAIDYSLDYKYDYFGFRTLEKSYLIQLDGVIVERPQHMLVRARALPMPPFFRNSTATNMCVCVLTRCGSRSASTMRIFKRPSGPTIERAASTSRTPRPPCSTLDFGALKCLPGTRALMRQRPHIHVGARLTLYRSFLLTMKEDSIEGIYETLKSCAMISKSAGGVGVSVAHVRASNSYIQGTNGVSNGLIPMLRVYNDTARYVDQGGGKRKGAFAIYLEPWHADILDFLDLKKNHGKEELRARDLFYGLWYYIATCRTCRAA